MIVMWERLLKHVRRLAIGRKKLENFQAMRASWLLADYYCGLVANRRGKQARRLSRSAPLGTVLKKRSESTQFV
jgi:hypothetical protein